MRCSIGIAPNRYLAKVGTELQKPDGLVVLCAEDLPQKLFSLKLRDLPGVGANIEHRIQMAGIANLPGLFALNPHQMRTIWAASGARSCGICCEAWNCRTRFSRAKSGLRRGLVLPASEGQTHA